MDIRTMEYYLAVIREGTISGAALSLHVAQPYLSRQMKSLEEELGVSLFERGSRRITLTKDGLILRKRAEEMIKLMQITKEELALEGDIISGTIRIGAGESHVFHYIAQAAYEISKNHPNISYEMVSGDTEDLISDISNGLLDFALIFSPYDHSAYQSISLPDADTLGVLMHRSCPLSNKTSITNEDLQGYPLIITRGAETFFKSNKELSQMKIIATYNLLYNASLMVEDGLGIAIAFDNIINTSGDGTLCFKPLQQQSPQTGTLIWKKYQQLSPASSLFIDTLTKIIKTKKS